jgi:hypothetical protein
MPFLSYLDAYGLLNTRGLFLFADFSPNPIVRRVSESYRARDNDS